MVTAKRIILALVGFVLAVGARLVRHARRLVFQLAEVSLTRKMFAQILGRIRQLEPVPG
jgi:hypothetical protein